MLHQNIHAYLQITDCHNPVSSSLYITCCSNIKDAFFNACTVHFLLFLLQSTNAQLILWSHKYTACTREYNVNKIFVSLINC
jgi:hypothetical protein